MTAQPPRRSSPLARPLFAALGLSCVALATLGIVVPGLPTTPFLLAAAYLFARSSPRLHDWLLAHRWFGPYIRAVRDDRALPLRAKVTTIAALWTSIGISIAMLAHGDRAGPFLVAALVSVGLGVSWFVGSWMRTAPAVPAPALRDRD